MWAHPLVADSFDGPLRDALRTAAGQVSEIVDELEQLPFGNAHGDACTRNLLRSESSDDIVLIDFAFWGKAPFGLDLGQLLLGEVQLGERDAGCLPVVEQACLPAYVAGMRAEGLRRAGGGGAAWSCVADVAVLRAIDCSVRAPAPVADA